MKFTKKLLVVLFIVLLALIIVPNIPGLEKSISVQAASTKLSKTKLTMNKKEKYTLKLKGSKKKVKWSSNKKSVASITSKGRITAKKTGNVVITAKVGGKKYKCKVKVEAPKLSQRYLTIQKNNSFQIKVKGTSQKVTWTSNNKKIAILCFLSAILPPK